MGLHASFKSLLFPLKIDNYYLKDKTIAIDAYIVLYKLLTTAVKQDGSPYLLDGKNVSHIIGFSWSYKKFFTKLNINPIFVFDGKPIPEKYEEINRRKENKNIAQKQYEEASLEGNIEDMKKYSIRTTKINYDIVKSFKDYLSVLGYSYVDAVHDGEALATELVNKGIADYALTQDTDAILYNCNSILRNMQLNESGSSDIVSTKRILENTGLNLDQLIYLGIITGTDYNQGIKGIGANKGLKYVENKNSIEEVVDSLINDSKIYFEDRNTIISKYKRTYDIFKETQDIKETDIIKGVADREKEKELISKIYSQNKSD